MANHDAAASALGYLYQVRWALLVLIRQSRSRPDALLTLEVLDDVSFEEHGAATELLQIKHHTTRAGLLGDMSVDVWKTLKVWVDGNLSRLPDGPLLSMVSTGVAQEGSAMAFLRTEQRDEAIALQRLDDAAATSGTQETAAARSAWLALAPHERQGIVARLRVYDGQASIAGVDELIRNELSLNAPFGHEEPYFDRVFEWWSKVAIGLLRKERDVVSGLDLRARLSDIRDYFRADNLPTTVQLADLDEEQLAREYGAEKFVHQLRWIDVNAIHLKKAVVDYHRAVTQTTKWLDNSLIGISEIQDFENNLVDEWQRAFADMVQDLGSEADEEAQKAAGLALFRALSKSTGITIRALYDEAFYARGKRHELANVGQLGWHPNFENMLAALVGIE